MHTINLWWKESVGVSTRHSSGSFVLFILIFNEQISIQHASVCSASFRPFVRQPVSAYPSITESLPRTMHHLTCSTLDLMWSFDMGNRVISVHLVNTILYDTMHCIYVHPKADKASLICHTEPNKK